MPAYDSKPYFPGHGKGGSAYANGKQRGAGRGESPVAGGRGDPGRAQVRPNGRQRAGLGGDGEKQSYRAQPEARGSGPAGLFAKAGKLGAGRKV